MALEQRIEDLRAIYYSPSACAADLLCDTHPPGRVAFTIVEPDLSFRDITYGELADRSKRFAAALAGLGVEPGDRVATLMGKSLDLVVALVGIWRRGAVHVPLFTAFAPATVEQRLAVSEAKVIICDIDQRAKVPAGEAADGQPLRVVVAAQSDEEGWWRPGDTTVRDLCALYQPVAPEASAVAVGGEGVLVQLYTSGTTGTPKAVPLPVKGLASLRAYLEYGLDVRDDDIYWNAADTGWGYGLFYGIIGPLTTGQRNILLKSKFSAELTWQILSRFQVTNFAAAPTVFRSMRNCGMPFPAQLELRCISSAGEPLTTDVIEWATDVFGVPVRDHYGQSEHGMLVINGWHLSVRRQVRPGSMGFPMPGWEIALLKLDSDEPAPAGEIGRIAIDVPASSLFWFPGYLGEAEQTAKRYSADGRWYHTGDVGSQDEDGYIYFSSRDDDVILMAGYRIGPFEVESALATHPAVAEAAVVGVPDELRGEVVAAFVVPSHGVEPSEELADDLRQHVKRTYSAHAYPREVHFRPQLPKGPSGKIQRFALRTLRGQEIAAERDGHSKATDRSE